MPINRPCPECGSKLYLNGYQLGNHRVRCKTCNYSEIFHKKPTPDLSKPQEPKSEKNCSACGDLKRLDEFHKNKNSKDGHVSVCKLCRVDMAKKYRRENLERIRKNQQRLYEINKDTVSARQRQYYEINKDKLSVKQKEYYEANRLKILAQQEEYQGANKLKLAVYRREYYAAKLAKSKRDRLKREATRLKRLEKRQKKDDPKDQT